MTLVYALAGLCALQFLLLVQGGMHALAFLAEERERATRERAELLQRIQAPEIAVQTYATQAPAPPPVMPLALDDDDAWHASREELADLLAR